MAYRYVSSITGEETLRPITADYDELVWAARKIFPFHQNECLNKIYDSNMRYEQILNKTQNFKEIDARLILNYEKNIKQSHRVASYTHANTMGLVNDEQVDVKVIQKEDTKGATNHGPEVNNPYPEPLTEGKYSVFLPEGNSPKLLTSEKEICEFINEWRAKGFPLNVNPKWGWVIEEDENKQRKLSVPANKFDWDKVHNILHDLNVNLKLLEVNLFEKLTSIGIKATEENAERVSNLVLDEKQIQELKKILTETGYKRFLEDTKNSIVPDEDKKINFALINDSFAKDFRYLRGEILNLRKKLKLEKDIIGKKVQIERLKLEPDIIYSPFVNHDHESYYDLLLEKNLLNMIGQVHRSKELVIAKRLEEYRKKYNAEITKLEGDIEAIKKHDIEVMKILHNEEIQSRMTEIKKLEEELEGLFSKYNEQFNFEPPAIEKAINSLKEKSKYHNDSKILISSSQNESKPLTKEPPNLQSKQKSDINTLTRFSFLSQADTKTVARQQSAMGSININPQKEDMKKESQTKPKK